jgi:hypothetical protein
MAGKPEYTSLNSFPINAVIQEERNRFCAYELPGK